jgi:hypothetical protein
MDLVLEFALSIFLPISLVGGPPASPSIAAPPIVATAHPQNAACAAAEFRQFDFWIGQWLVRNTDGKQIGTSEVSAESAGCAIREQWKAASGVLGMSINYYDAAQRQWHQDWVGGDGTILHLRGGMHDGAMVLSGEAPGRQGPIINRITWTPSPGGVVKQEWATSNNSGADWAISFVGIYTHES